MIVVSTVASSSIKICLHEIVARGDAGNLPYHAAVAATRTPPRFWSLDVVDIALWILVVLLIVVGVAGTVLPALPGVILVLAGIILGAWIDDFTRVGGVTVAVVSAIGVAAWLIEYLAGVMGAKKVGASKEAIFGALIGTVLGIFTGLWGLLFMPLLGAVAGQYLVDRDWIRARNVGIATWIGMAIGTLAKIALTFLMIGVFIAALLIA